MKENLEIQESWDKDEIDIELAKTISNMPSASFKNKHNEQFNIHSDGVVTFMSGDEVNAMVDDKYKIAGKYVPLFNSHFDIWSANELYELGKALMELHKEG